MNIYYQIESMPKSEPFGRRVFWTVQERNGAYALFDANDVQVTPTFHVLTGAALGAIKFLDQIGHASYIDRVPGTEYPDDKSILQVPTALRDERLQREHGD